MKHRSLLVTILFLTLSGVVFGQSHLLLVSQGDGGLTKGEDGKPIVLTKASYLPSNQIISVRARSGLETLSAGYNFRFGSDTNFLLLKDGIELNSGSVMIKSRNIKNTTIIKGPEAELQIAGAGTCLIEVETSGGFKVVGALGRFKLESIASSDTVELMPGELCFLMPGDRGFGDRVNINLSKLIESSYLISGFPNPKSFVSALDNIAKEQQKAIGKSFNAQVGDSKDPDSFEIITRESNSTISPAPSGNERESLKEDEGYIIPSTDPLSELLGRAPRRFGDTISIQVPAVESQNTKKVEQDASNVGSDDVNKDEKPFIENVRAFPSRLLRKP